MVAGMQSIASEFDITVERLEIYLDRLAEIMAHPLTWPEALLPLYERIEQEIATRQTRNGKIDAIKARAGRLKDQKVARS